MAILVLGHPVLCITCTDLAVFMRLCASLAAIIAALADCLIAYDMFCFAAISLLYFLCLRLPYVSLPYFCILRSALGKMPFSISFGLPCMRLLVSLLLRQPYVKLLAFHFWHYVMSPTVVEDNTIGSFYLYHLLHLLSMIIKSGVLCTSRHLYTIIMCTDGTMVYMSPYILLGIAYAIDVFL